MYQSIGWRCWKLQCSIEITGHVVGIYIVWLRILLDLHNPPALHISVEVSLNPFVRRHGSVIGRISRIKPCGWWTRPDYCWLQGFAFVPCCCRMVLQNLWSFFDFLSWYSMKESFSFFFLFWCWGMAEKCTYVMLLRLSAMLLSSNGRFIGSPKKRYKNRGRPMAPSLQLGLAVVPNMQT